MKMALFVFVYDLCMFHPLSTTPLSLYFFFSVFLGLFESVCVVGLLGGNEGDAMVQAVRRDIA